ncbi:B12-binding domain-containing radical SAM protein [Planctomycetaceae bacterium SH139]
MRIGLIALSGIRVCDEELMRLGMTLPGFVERSKTIASLPSLGLLTLAGMTPPRHQVTYLEVDQLQDVHQWPQFDLVALSTFTAQARDAYRIADQYRAAGSTVVMGGLHVTALPDEAAAHADAVMVGEGELCWLEMLADAEAGTLQPIYHSQPREFDLAEAPMPAFELLDMQRYNRITIQVTRGCPWRCTFCASSILLTQRYKHKPAERVLAEIDRVRELWSRPFLEFADDNSFVNRNYWKDLLPQLAERRLRWFTESDISVANDPELLTLMRKAGCVEVLIGLESPIATGLEGLEIRRDWKHQQLDRYQEAIHRIQSHGIRVNGCFILGLDGQTPDIFDRVYEFTEQLELYDVQITLQTPFPGTPLYETLRSEGRLLEPDAWHRCTLFDLTYEPTPMSREELVDGFRELARRLYCDSFTTWRRENFRRKYLRPARKR